MVDNMDIIKNTNNPINDEKLLQTNINDGIWLQTLIAILLVLLTIVTIFVYLRKFKSKTDVLLLGLSDSGKTLIFSRLFHDKYVQTHTSIKKNLDVYQKPSGTILNIIDIPGHKRLREKYFDEHKSNIRGIVFVIDSSTIQKDIRDVAEYLYTILTDILMVSSSAIDVLILCNKQDVITSKGSTVISHMLENELNTLRSTKANQLDSIDANNKDKLLQQLGRDNNKEFQFQMLPFHVQFGESTALFNKDDEKPAALDDLRDWLHKL